MPGLRDVIKDLSPTWLQTGVAEKFLYVCGLGMDALLEKLNEGIRMRMPGYGDVSGLPYIGADRLITQGLSETAAAYVLRLKAWLDDWQRAGSAPSVLQQLFGYVSPAAPMMRTVSNSSVWDTYIEGSTPQTQTPAHYLASPANFNWDNNGDAHQPGQIPWWRWWLVMFAGTTVAGGPITAATNASPIAISTTRSHGLSTGAQVFVQGVNGNLAANGQWTVTVTGGNSYTLNGSAGNGAYTSGGIGYAIGPNNWVLPEGSWDDGGTWDDGGAWDVNVSPGYVAGIRSLVGLWKAAHSWCRWIVIVWDATLFDPNQPADGVHNPNGGFAHWSTVSNGQYVPARFDGASYADGIATSGNQGPNGWPPSGTPGFPTY